MFRAVHMPAMRPRIIVIVIVIVIVIDSQARTARDSLHRDKSDRDKSIPILEIPTWQLRKSTRRSVLTSKAS